MTARKIISAIPEVIRVAIRSWIALQQGKRYASKGVQVFQNTLQVQGLPEDVVNALTTSYQANLKLLSIRELSQFSIRVARQQSS